MVLPFHLHDYFHAYQKISQSNSPCPSTHSSHPLSLMAKSRLLVKWVRKRTVFLSFPRLSFFAWFFVLRLGSDGARVRPPSSSMDDTRGFAWCDVLVRSSWIVPAVVVGSRPHLPILSPTMCVLHMDQMGWNRRWTVHRKKKKRRIGVRIDLLQSNRSERPWFLSILDGFIDDPPVLGWVRRFASLGSERTAPGATKTRKMEFDHRKVNRTNQIGGTTAVRPTVQWNQTQVTNDGKERNIRVEWPICNVPTRYYHSPRVKQL